MAKPIQQVTKLPGRVLQETGIVPKMPSEAPRPAATPVAPVAGQERVAPRAAVAAGGEDQMAATGAQTRRRRASGMVTGSQGVTTAAATQKKTLLGQ